MYDSLIDLLSGSLLSYFFKEEIMINEALRLLRVFNEVKLKELSQKMEISVSYLSEIENGKKKPSLEIIQKYADVFNLKASEILFFSEKIQTNNPKTQVKSIISRKLIEFLISVENEGSKEVLVKQ